MEARELIKSRDIMNHAYVYMCVSMGCCCFLHINRSGLNHTQYYTWLPIRYVVCWTKRDQRNIYQAPMRAKEKHKQTWVWVRVIFDGLVPQRVFFFFKPVKGEEEEKDCPICMCTVTGEAEAAFLDNCVHAFHFGCITKVRAMGDLILEEYSGTRARV